MLPRGHWVGWSLGRRARCQSSRRVHLLDLEHLSSDCACPLTKGNHGSPCPSLQLHQEAEGRSGPLGPLRTLSPSPVHTLVAGTSQTTMYEMVRWPTEVRQLTQHLVQGGQELLSPASSHPSEAGTSQGKATRSLK